MVTPAVSWGQHSDSMGFCGYHKPLKLLFIMNSMPGHVLHLHVGTAQRAAPPIWGPVPLEAPWGMCSRSE